jgi:hypothetical protein
MLIAEGHATTPRADRYLRQLCGHLGRLSHRAIGHGHSRAGGHGPDSGVPAIRHSSVEGRRGSIVFDWGTCSLEADDQALHLRIEADDIAALQRAREQISHRIETIGRREQVVVTWRS